MAVYEGVNYSVFLQVMTSLQINNHGCYSPFLKVSFD